MYKQQKIILLKRIMTGILVACLMIINNNTDKAYAENNYNESEQVVNVGITTDKSLYSANDDMSVTVTLTNYDNQFYGDITTMIVQLDYDESVITQLRMLQIKIVVWDFLMLMLVKAAALHINI